LLEETKRKKLHSTVLRTKDIREYAERNKSWAEKTKLKIRKIKVNTKRFFKTKENLHSIRDLSLRKYEKV